MLFLEKDLKFCFDAVKGIAAEYELQHLNSADPRRSVEDLLDTCRIRLGCKIDIYELDIHKDQSSVWGMYLNTPDGFEIAHVQGLNFCWRRYVTCKELFHVVLDNDEYRNMDIAGHVQEVTVAFPDTKATSAPGRPVAAELLAEFAAMEFLFPYQRRLVELVGPDKGNYLAIAETYKVPQVHIERYLAPSFMEALKPYCST